MASLMPEKTLFVPCSLSVICWDFLARILSITLQHLKDGSSRSSIVKLA